MARVNCAKKFKRLCINKPSREYKLYRATERMLKDFKVADFLKMTYVMHSMIRKMTTDASWHQYYLLYSAQLQAELYKDNKIHDPIPETDPMKSSILKS